MLLPLSTGVFYHGKIQIEGRLVNSMCQSYDMNIRGNTNSACMFMNQSDIICILFTFSDFIFISIVWMQSYCKSLTLSKHNVCYCAEYSAYDLSDHFEESPLVIAVHQPYASIWMMCCRKRWSNYDVRGIKWNSTQMSPYHLHSLIPTFLHLSNTHFFVPLFHSACTSLACSFCTRISANTISPCRRMHFHPLLMPSICNICHMETLGNQHFQSNYVCIVAVAQ